MTNPELAAEVLRLLVTNSNHSFTIPMIVGRLSLNETYYTQVEVILDILKGVSLIEKYFWADGIHYMASFKAVAMFKEKQEAKDAKQ